MVCLESVSSAGSPATLEALATQIEAAMADDRLEVATISPSTWLMIARFALLLLKELDL